MKRTTKSVLVFALTASMVLSNAGAGSAKAKKPKLSKSKVTITVGKKVTIKVKKVKPKKTKWTLNKKGKKIVSLSKKKKTSVKIKGKKKGKATLTAKIKVGKKTYKKKVKITVKKKTTVKTPAPTAKVTQVPNVPTPTPVGSGTPATDVPATTAPATDVPATTAPATDVPATTAPATDVPTDKPTVPTPAEGFTALEISNDTVVDPANKTTVEDGILTANKTGQVGVQIPGGVTNGQTLNVIVTGTYSAEENLRSFISNSSYGAVSNVANTADAVGYDRTNINWSFTLTATADTNPAYVLIKGATPGADMSGVLVITSVQIQDATVVPSAKPSAKPTETASGGAADVTPRPETTVVPAVVSGGSVHYNDLSANDEYIVTAAGKEIQATAEVIAAIGNLFDAEDAYSKWTTKGDTEKVYDNGVKVETIKDENDNTKRTVVVTENGVAKTYAATMTKKESGLEVSAVNASGSAVTAVVSGNSVSITRDDAKVATVTKNEDGTYSVAVDETWAKDNGLKLEKLAKQGPNPGDDPITSPTPTATGGAATGSAATGSAATATPTATATASPSPTATATASPSPTPTVTPKPEGLVTLSAANEAGKMVDGNVSYDEETGAVTFTAKNQYSGGGVWFWVNDDKSPIKVSDYKTVTIKAKASTIQSAESHEGIDNPVVLCLGSATEEQATDYWAINNDHSIGWDGYGHYNSVGTTTKTITIDLSKVKDQDANIYQVMLKYNAYYNEGNGEKPFDEKVTFTIESIQFNK